MLKINIKQSNGNNIRFYFTGDIKPFNRYSENICQTTFFRVYSSSYPELDETDGILYVFGYNVERDWEEINTDIKTFIKVNTTIHLFNKYSEKCIND